MLILSPSWDRTCWDSCISSTSCCSLEQPNELNFCNDLNFSTPGISSISLHSFTSSIRSFVSCANPLMLFSLAHSDARNSSKDSNVSRLGSSSNSLDSLMSSCQRFARPQSPLIFFNAQQDENSSVTNVDGNAPTSNRSLQDLILRCCKLEQTPLGNDTSDTIVQCSSNYLSARIRLSMSESNTLCPLRSVKAVFPLSTNPHNRLQNL